MSIFNTLNQPNWRYKLLWLVISAAVWALAHRSSKEIGEDPVLVFSALSTMLAGCVITWYAVLAGAGKLARAYFASRDSSISLTGDIIVVWLVTCGTWGAALLVTGFDGTTVNQNGFFAFIGSTIAAFVAVMRTLDLRDDSQKIISVTPRIEQDDDRIDLLRVTSFDEFSPIAKWSPMTNLAAIESTEQHH